MKNIFMCTCDTLHRGTIKCGNNTLAANNICWSDFFTIIIVTILSLAIIVGLFLLIRFLIIKKKHKKSHSFLNGSINQFKNHTRIVLVLMLTLVVTIIIILIPTILLKQQVDRIG